MYELDLEKLSEEQLEAFSVIDMAAVKLERERRVKESIYDDNDEVFLMEDASKAYFYLRPLVDNMRNNDTKKTIIKSGVIEMLEKLLRTAKAKLVEYEPYDEIAPVAYASGGEAQKFDKVKEELEAENILDKTITPLATSNFVSPIIPMTSEPVTAPVMTPAEIQAPKPQPLPEANPLPNTAISQDKLNEILAGIPVVGKI